MERALTIDERWDLVDQITRETVEVGRYERSLKDVLGEITVRPLIGIPFAIAVLFGFWSFFCDFAGTLFTDGFMVKIFDEHFLPWIQNVFPLKGTPIYYFFVGDPEAENCFEAFGVLTSGLFVPFGVVLWAVLAFYLVLSFLEDIGYMPRLAVLVDTLFHKIGLHGFAITPILLSLGCNVPGVTATRSLETRKQRFMAMTLLGVFVPCGAQIGIMLELVPQLLGWIILALVVGFFVIGYILSRIWPGPVAPEILLDVPSYQVPTGRNIGRKLWMRTFCFLVIAVPFVLLGCAIVQLLYITGGMDKLASGLGPFLTGLWGVPKETVAPLVAGFLRKDLAVGMLGGIEMTTYQLFSGVVLLTIYFPCLATFALLLKEENWKEFLGSLGTLIVMALAYGGILHLIGLGIGGY